MSAAPGTRSHVVPGAGRRLAAWARQHRLALVDTIRQLSANWMTTTVGVVVIALAFALPLSIYVAYTNFSRLIGQLGDDPQIILYLDTTSELAAADAVLDELRGDPRFHSARLIHRDDALLEFSVMTDLQPVVASLDENPLPHTIVVAVEPFRVVGEKGDNLKTELEALPGVAETQFEMSWIERLLALNALFARMLWVFGAILALAVVIISGNTIRYGIQQRRQEIAVAKLVGATDRYVKRPFLYSGALHGLGGALIAAMVVHLAFGLISSPAEALARTYESHFHVSGISLFLLVFSGIFGLILGWLGAWLTVTAYLRRIRPD